MEGPSRDYLVKWKQRRNRNAISLLTVRVVLSVLGSILICSWIYAIQKHLLLFIVGKDVCGPQFVKLLAVIALGWELGEEGKNELEYTHSGEECVE